MIDINQRLEEYDTFVIDIKPFGRGFNGCPVYVVESNGRFCSFVYREPIPLWRDSTLAGDPVKSLKILDEILSQLGSRVAYFQYSE